MDTGIVFIALFICASAMLFGIRYLLNKEKMAMIERGMDPGMAKSRPSSPKPFISLKFGLLMAGLGLGLLLSFFLVKEAGIDEDEAVAVYFGLLGIFGGIGLIVSYIIEKKWLDQQK